MAARADARAHGTLCKLEQRRKKGFSQSFDGLGVVFFFSFLLMRVRARALLLRLLAKCFVKTEHFYHVSFSFLLSMEKSDWLVSVTVCVPTSRKTSIYDHDQR